MSYPQPALVELSPDTVSRYVEADQELQLRLGNRRDRNFSCPSL